MVFCDFVKTENNKIIYAFGGTSKDITGELAIAPSDPLSFEVTKDPENCKVSLRHIEYMIGRHIQEFKKGMYPPKMSYQI